MGKAPLTHIWTFLKVFYSDLTIQTEQDTINKTFSLFSVHFRYIQSPAKET